MKKIFTLFTLFLACTFAFAQNYNVTLKVNTANITVGANGMYAGGGFLGGSDGLQLTDADGDGTWEGVATVAAGSGPNYYAFFNSPNGSSDWGTKEDLSGQPCGVASNYNDRVLPTITSDTTIQHCYGNCAFDGTCVAPPVPTCDYIIDMQDSWGDGWNGASIDVSVNGSVVANATIGTGSSGVATISTMNGDAVDFTFNSGSYDSEITFQITDPAGAVLGSYGPSPSTGSFLTHTSNSICNVHFSVNTQLITVGANGMYAGGGVLGDAMAVPLSDNDLDGTWEGFAVAPNAGGNYIFLNSPNNGGDWGAKEDLSGLPCGDPNNYNDRILAPFTGNIALQHCFGSCETDGSCPAAAGCNYTITMQDSWGDGWNGASIDVSVNGANVANLTIPTGSTGLDTIPTIVGDVVEFTFNSGSYDSEVTFQITDPTGATLGSYGPSPTTGVFLTHTSNSICQPATVNVTFQVDMGLVSSAFTTPEVNGTWNNWCGNCNPMTDADGDGVWEATIPLSSGSYEYKYSADAWTIQEMNDPTASCTNGNPTYTNRTLSVGTTDMTISTVCWGSCTPCFYSPQAPTGITCATGSAGLTFSDDIVPANGWSGDLGTGSSGGFWNVGSGGTPSGSTGPSGAHSGSDYLFFESSGSGLDTATAVTPMIDLTTSTSDAELTFWMYGYGAAIGTLDVGVSTSATGPFTSVFNITGAVQTPSDPWAQIGVNIGSYVGQQIYVGFTYARDTTGATSFQGDLAIDLVQVNSCVSCPAPSGLTASNVTGSSADLSWTATGTETEWFLIVNGAGTTQTSTTANLTGLMGNTTYTAQVHAVCAPGDTSFASAAVSFTTLCPITYSAPYLENFDVNIACWTQDTTDNFDWTLDANGTPSIGTGPTDDITGGGNYIFIETSSGSTGDSAMIHSADIDLSSLTNPQLKFWSHMYGASAGELSVWITDASGSMSQVFIKNGDQGNQWNEELVSLSGYSGVVNFTVLGVKGTSFTGDLAIDDFEVREEPSCAAPSTVSIVGVGSDTATVSWVTNDPSVTAWNYVVGPTGFDPLTGTPVGVTSGAVTLTGLTASTSYDFYVQSDCGAAGLSSWIGPNTFTTNAAGGTCGYFTVEVFDSYGDGWNGNGLVVSINGVVTDTLATTAADGQNGVITLIPVDIGDVLDFDYVIDAYATGAPTTWIGENSYTILDANNILIGSGAYDAAILTVNSVLGLTACPSCSQPYALTTSNITTNSADLAWTAGGTETQWNIQYDTAGFAPGTGTVMNVTTNPYTLTGLTSATAYDYWVQAVCGSDSSAYAGPFTFATTCGASLAPTNENFDAGFPVCWSQETNDQFDWTVDANGTTSSGTGPSDDFTGNGNYMYTEASLPRAHGDTATMYSEVIDISGLSNPELRFLNHMYGSAIGTLSVDLWDASTGTNLSTVFTHSGDRGDQWNEELIMLSTTATTIQFSITAVLDTNASGLAWPGDIAIDEFGVREAAANDLALVAAAVASGCDLTATEPIELWVENQGLVAESGFDLSYAVNGGTPVVESITSTVNPGDTLKYVFTATADMTADGVYNLDFACILSTDTDLADNALNMMAENYDTPMAPTTMGDTICDGDTAMVSADEYSYWYDAATGGNLVGEGDEIDVMPTATTSYYAEAAAIAGHFEDFDSYNVGDYIVASDPNNWDVWPGGTPGGAYDMQIDDAQGNGGNSLRVFNSDTTDVVLEFGEAFSTGYFYYAMDMYIVGEGYINFQEDVNIGTTWNMSITMIGGVLNIDVDGASVLTGAYTATNPTGNPVWNTFEFECDYSTGTWEVFVNGNSQGTFINPDPVASVNIYPGPGVEYYLDNVEWGALKDDACRSTSRTEAVVTVEDCSNIIDLSFEDLSIYPNPNNGQFTITNSQEMTDIIITDLQGKIIYNSNNINLNKVNVELNNLEKGMYMINIKTNNGMITKTVTVH